MSTLGSSVSKVSEMISSKESASGEESVPETVEANKKIDASEAGEATEPSVDVIFEVLKNERRRRVIEYLREHDEPAVLGDVAEHIAALENDKDEAAITYAERKRVYVGLYQCHLPKMDDMGIVNFNRARGRIELTEQAPHLVPYLDGPESGRKWYRYYGSIVLGGLGLYGLALTELLPTTATVQVALVAVLLAVAVCTIGHVSE